MVWTITFGCISSSRALAWPRSRKSQLRYSAPGMRFLFGFREAATTREQDGSAAKAAVMNDPTKPQPPVTRTVPSRASLASFCVGIVATVEMLVMLLDGGVTKGSEYCSVSRR